MRNEEYDVHGILYNIVGVVSRIFFAIGFFTIGVLAIIHAEDSSVKILGGVFAASSIFIINDGIKYYKDLKEIIDRGKTVSDICITINHIGYFILCLLFIYIMIMFILMLFAHDSNNNLINSILATPSIYLIIWGIIGSLIIFLGYILKIFNINTTIIRIRRNKKID